MDDFLPMLATGVCCLAIGVMFGVSVVDGPRIPQFHEAIGAGSRVSLYQNQQGKQFATFSYKSAQYTVPLPVK